MSEITEKTKESQNDEEPFGLGCALEMFSEVNEVLEMIENIKTIVHSQQHLTEKAHEKFIFILGQYQEQPHLLDSHIDILLNNFISLIRVPSNSMEMKHVAFKYMCILIKVRGYKVIVRHLPHEV